MAFSFSSLIPLPHYFVPPCPCCGSKRTGRFIKSHNVTNTDWAVRNALKNGELVKPTSDIDPDGQLFCLDCGFTWTEPIEARIATPKEITEERQKRGTIDILNALEEEDRDDKREAGKKHGLINSYVKFIGKF